jgi:2-polyprenyl-6-methoxyphenol hydroxylase-like FAD-dependent oxidoreductase
MNKNNLNFIIVGASIAGCSAAIMLKKNGALVTIIERSESIDSYKKLCTHFIQPISTSILQEIGLLDFVKENGLKSKAKFYTPAGVIESSGPYSDKETSTESYAYNIERSVLDPELRKILLEHDIELKMNASFKEVTIAEDHCIVTIDDNGKNTKLECDVLIAADGRTSSVSKFCNFQQQEFQNDRLTIFAYFEGYPFGELETHQSHFVIDGNDMGFIYPLKKGKVLLSWYYDNKSENKPSNQEDRIKFILEKMSNAFPDFSFDSLKCISNVYGYNHFPNQLRNPISKNIALIGDACASVDPLSGVGCSMALKSASLLTEAYISFKQDGVSFLDEYLKKYQEEIMPHLNGIIADSRINYNQTKESIQKKYLPIIRDKSLRDDYLNLTGRLIYPKDFQKRYLFSSIKQSKTHI